MFNILKFINNKKAIILSLIVITVTLILSTADSQIVCANDNIQSDNLIVKLLLSDNNIQNDILEGKLKDISINLGDKTIYLKPDIKDGHIYFIGESDTDEEMKSTNYVFSINDNNKVLSIKLEEKYEIDKYGISLHNVNDNSDIDVNEFWSYRVFNEELIKSIIAEKDNPEILKNLFDTVLNNFKISYNNHNIMLSTTIFDGQVYLVGNSDGEEIKLINISKIVKDSSNTEDSYEFINEFTHEFIVNVLIVYGDLYDDDIELISNKGNKIVFYKDKGMKDTKYVVELQVNGNLLNMKLVK